MTSKITTGFAVNPKRNCPHLKTLSLDDVSRFMSINFQHKCADCDNVGENWVCLTCAHVACSYYVNKHMQAHHDTTKHPVVLSFSDLSFWCYACDTYIKSGALNEVYNLFQNKKFSEKTTIGEIEKMIGKIGSIEIGETAPVKEEKKVDRVPEIAQNIGKGKYKKIAVLTGAGLSVAAGIPDFRSPGVGLYYQLEKYKLPFPEAVFSIQYFLENPEPFYIIAKGMMGDYLPTKTHYFIRLLQDKGVMQRNYTQNIDNLEELAGIKPDNLVQAHGSIKGSHCAKCSLAVDHKAVMEGLKTGKVYYCPKCKGPCKPDIVMFGESLPTRFSLMYKEVADADLVIVIGTSLNVFPFNTLLELAGKDVPRLIINKDMPSGLADPSNPGFVFLLGACDETIGDFIKMIGWSKEFEALLKEREALAAKLKKA